MGRRPSRLALLLPVVFLLVSAVSLMVIDQAVGEILSAARTFRLKNASERELPGLRAAADALEQRVHSLREQLGLSRQRQLPAVADLKTIAASNGLRIDRIERLRTKQEQSLFPEYRITFHGAVGGLARLLHELEGNFLCGATHVDLWPYDADGSLVAMSITIATREQ